MYQRVRLAIMVVAGLALVPALAMAQASITGVVRDTSGAVLPGVTVEASSPALIEKVRVAITDGTGQYRIENLRPGEYAVTFTLPGFAVVRREGIELSGSFVATVNTDMRVGGLEETITVTGESPTVDVQSTTRQSVLDQELLSTIPAGQNTANVAMLMPSVVTSGGGVDLSGVDGEARFSPPGSQTIRGVQEPRTVIGGLSLHSAQGSGLTGAGNFLAYDEVVVDTGGITVEQAEGGLRMELIPREGGNTYSGALYGAFANEDMQGNNFTQELRDQGLSTPNSLKKFADFNWAIGGPIAQDRVWFHAAGRYNIARDYVAGLFVNRNAGNPDAWTLDFDESQQALREPTWKGADLRVTWQATEKHKFSVAYDYQNTCQCPRPRANRTLEAAEGDRAANDPKDYVFGDWTAPLTNRLLVEAHGMKHREHAFRPRNNTEFVNDPGGRRLIGVTEQTGNIQYRADTGQATDTWNRTVLLKGAASYITGAHSFRFGVSHDRASQEQERFAIDAPISYRFRNGVPNRITLEATPYDNLTNSSVTALFLQDRWTVDRLTVNAGVRYDYFHSYFPSVTLGPGEFVPDRNFTLPGGDGVSWHDLSPRLGLAYDVFGTGRTALKVSLNKYLGFHGLTNRGGPFTTAMAPASRIINNTRRSWNDANGDFVPDCDLLNPAPNGECGRSSSPNFGTPREGNSYDPDTLTGWGKRDFNWQFSAGVQQELMPRVSLDFDFFRTWFGNFIVIDNLTLSAADFDSYSITAPADSRLPGGGGYVVDGLVNVKPEKFGLPVQNYITFSDNFGDGQSMNVTGIDLSVNMRPGAALEGLFVRGGINTQRTSWDDCAVRAQVPEALGGLPSNLPEPDPFSYPYCDVTGDFRTQFKLLSSYTIPRIDVLVSGTFQTLAGPEILAEYVATNAAVSPSLGRNLAGGARNQEVNIVEPGTLYGPRVTQLDFRVGKVLRFGGTRTTISLDVFNVLNEGTPVQLSNSFGNWQAPQEIMRPRFAKIVAQFDF